WGLGWWHRPSLSPPALSEGGHSGPCASPSANAAGGPIVVGGLFARAIACRPKESPDRVGASSQSPFQRGSPRPARRVGQVKLHGLAGPSPGPLVGVTNRPSDDVLLETRRQRPACRSGGRSASGFSFCFRHVELGVL